MMGNIFFVSDTHYGHKNITGSTISSWKDGYRCFNTIEKMNTAIVNGINSKVKQDDTLYHLGDWSFGGIDNIWNLYKQLICKNIHFIYGNHDDHIINDRQLPNCRRIAPYHQTIVDGCPEAGEYPDYVLSKQLFLTTNDVLTIDIGKQKIFMSHYAHRVWLGSHKGVWHLYGHSHGALEDKEWGKSMDVGIDNYCKLFGKYEPFSFEEIRTIMDKREVINHH